LLSTKFSKNFFAYFLPPPFEKAIFENSDAKKMMFFELANQK